MPAIDEFDESELLFDSPSIPEPTRLSINADENGKVIVSRFLKRRGGERLSFHNFGPLWLPPVLFVPQATIDLGIFFSKATVGDKCVWNKRQAYRIIIDEKERETNGTLYYSVALGILIGAEIQNPSMYSDGASQKTVLELSGSNISGL
jgi:hypothetical protein